MCLCVALERVVIICLASTHTALVTSPSLAVLHLPTYIHLGGATACAGRSASTSRRKWSGAAWEGGRFGRGAACSTGDGAMHTAWACRYAKYEGRLRHRLGLSVHCGRVWVLVRNLLFFHTQGLPVTKHERTPSAKRASKQNWARSQVWKNYKGQSADSIRKPLDYRAADGRRSRVDDGLEVAFKSATDTRNTLPGELDTTDTHNRRPKCQEGRH